MLAFTFFPFFSIIRSYMKNIIKYEKLSKRIKDEIKSYYELTRETSKNLTLEDAMTLWFKECFEDWIKENYAFTENSEKRKHFRIDIEIPVKIVDTLIESHDKDSIDVNLAGTILNISRGGLYFVSTKHIEPSSIVMTRIDLSSIDPELYDVEALAMVVRSKQLDDGKYGIGLMFSSIYDNHKENLDLFIFKNVAYYIYSL